MARIPKISEAEWAVMRVLWDRAPQTANDVVDAVAEGNAWSPRTVKTLLNRLVKKGALTYRVEGRIYHYLPAVAEALCAREESRSLLQRVYGGALTPMLVHLIEDGALSAGELAELKQLLEKREG